MGTIEQLKFARGYTIGRLSSSKETAWDEQPTGFNNTIRWNAGHIYVTMEHFIGLVLPTYEKQHEDWGRFFATGTSPANWDSQPPTNEEILDALQEQTNRVSTALEGKLNEVLPEPVKLGTIFSMDSVDAVAQFVIWHEGVHAGVIHGLNRVIGE
ncbi:DinB family protein [Sporosarcina contaminans]|uniref:DinB family protein n=1 Tax=Sporosarcina contaminans TaxID=633403 RepID=A0ABW3TVD6_9BACL